MHPWDLLPASCRERFDRRRRVRRWALVYASVTLTLAGAGAALLWHAGRQAVRAEQLRAQVRAHWLRNEEAAELVAEVSGLRDDILRYNRLAWPVRVSHCVAAIVSRTPTSTTLTSLTLSPQEDAPAPRRRGETAEAAEPKTWMSIEISGVAEDDADVASLVSGVEEHPLFSDVKLDFARSREIERTLFREFRVKCRIDLSRQYLMVAEAEGGDP